MAQIIVTSPPSPTFERGCLFPRYETYERAYASTSDDEEEELARLRLRQAAHSSAISESSDGDASTWTTRRKRTSSGGSTASNRRRARKSSPPRKQHIPEPPSWHSSRSSRPYDYPIIAGRRRSATSSPHLSPEPWAMKLPVLLPDTSAALQRASEAVQVGLVALLGITALSALVGVLFASCACRFSVFALPAQLAHRRSDGYRLTRVSEGVDPAVGSDPGRYATAIDLCDQWQTALPTSSTSSDPLQRGSLRA
jgi:hypothetical protein